MTLDEALADGSAFFYDGPTRDELLQWGRQGGAYIERGYYVARDSGLADVAGFVCVGEDRTAAEQVVEERTLTVPTSRERTAKLLERWYRMQGRSKLASA